MDCIRVSQNIYDYLDGEIGRVQRAAVSRHLDGCPACNAGFRFEVRFRQTLWASCQEEPPAGLRERILDRLTAATPPLASPVRSPVEPGADRPAGPWAGGSSQAASDPTGDEGSGSASGSPPGRI